MYVYVSKKTIKTQSATFCSHARKTFRTLIDCILKSNRTILKKKNKRQTRVAPRDSCCRYQNQSISALGQRCVFRKMNFTKIVFIKYIC